ncbi:hypothetical protein ACFVFJ_44710 [Streptomyces sp. NPDC057717]|uniref:hypothetical protein n=1 Tax=Streptomyces sp. NPDC057717 TaxID=3346224 RepID=UPI0036B43A41
MEVERKAGAHFAPYINDRDTGCLFVFHEVDITKEGADWFSAAMTDQAKRWVPRPTGMALGKTVPVRIVREPNMPEPFALHYKDSADEITYTVDASAIEEEAAAEISRQLTARSPHWQRVPDAERALMQTV